MLFCDLLWCRLTYTQRNSLKLNVLLFFETFALKLNVMQQSALTKNDLFSSLTQLWTYIKLYSIENYVICLRCCLFGDLNIRRMYRKYFWFSESNKHLNVCLASSPLTCLTLLLLQSVPCLISLVWVLIIKGGLITK